MSEAQQRLKRLLKLIDSFDEKDGQELVDALIATQDQRGFRFISRLVVPKWIVKLNGTLSESPGCLSREQLTWLYLELAGSKLPAVEPHLQELLASEGDCKVATIAYCIDKHVDANQSPELLADFRDKSKSDQLSPESQDIISRLIRECFD